MSALRRDDRRAASLCRHCGAAPHAAPPHPPEYDDEDDFFEEPPGAFDALIPRKNPPALIGYYLGVFSVIPFFPIGVAAFFLGLKGLKVRDNNPKAYGGAHAWVEILVGGFFRFGWLLLTIAMILWGPFLEW